MWPPVPTPVMMTSIGGIAEVVEDFDRGGAGVDVDIGRVFELLRHPGTRRLVDEFEGTLDRALHALFARGQIKGRAVSQHQAAAFEAHALGHDQHELIALDRRDHRQADAGIARSRLDDRAAGLQMAVLFRCLDHGERDAVLDRPARIGAFGLDPHFGAREQLLDADVRRVADRVQDGVGFHGVASSSRSRESCGLLGGSKVLALRMLGKR